MVYDTFDSNEVLETKVLHGDKGYELVIPSNHNVPRYIQAQAILSRDKAQLPGAKNLDPAIMAHMAPFDSAGKCTVPYMWGAIGAGTSPCCTIQMLDAAWIKLRIGVLSASPVIASFTSGPGAATLPMRIYNQVRLGVNPEINAISALLIGLVATGIAAAYLVQRRSAAQG